MGILKGILHHWNKTTKSYDTIHPETEVAQITDWNNGIVNTLASTALGTLVSTLTSDSLLATMIKKVLTATGVKYNIAQNGYLCFGDFFGGLIIQWGTSVHGWVSFPIIFNLHRVIITNHQGTAYYNSKPLESDTLTGFTLDVGENNDVSMDAYWIAIGL